MPRCINLERSFETFRLLLTKLVFFTTRKRYYWLDNFPLSESVLILDKFFVILPSDARRSISFGGYGRCKLFYQRGVGIVLCKVAGLICSQQLLAFFYISVDFVFDAILTELAVYKVLHSAMKQLLLFISYIFHLCHHRREVWFYKRCFEIRVIIAMPDRSFCSEGDKQFKFW